LLNGRGRTVEKKRERKGSSYDFLSPLKPFAERNFWEKEKGKGRKKPGPAAFSLTQPCELRRGK